MRTQLTVHCELRTNRLKIGGVEANICVMDGRTDLASFKSGADELSHRKKRKYNSRTTDCRLTVKRSESETETLSQSPQTAEKKKSYKTRKVFALEKLPALNVVPDSLGPSILFHFHIDCLFCPLSNVLLFCCCPRRYCRC